MSALVREIMGALPEDFMRRMRNWARAKCGDSMGFAQVNWDAAGSGRGETRSPILSGEAEDTDRALQTLPARYRRAVELFWAWETQELAVLARRCGGIDYRTYAARVMEGHDLVRAALSRQTEAWRRRSVANAMVARRA